MTRILRHPGFLTLILLLGLSSPAPAQNDPRKDFVITLNEMNIKEFLQEVSAISTGQRPDMMDEDVADYFTNHIAEKGTFKSIIRFQIPGFPTQDGEMKLNREEYAASVIKGRYMLEDYVTEVNIQDLKISSNGKSATFKSVTKERGKMPMIKDEKKKDQIEMVPIQGESTCEQRLVVSLNNFIQMANADCTTLISFDAFGGKPLVPQ